MRINVSSDERLPLVDVVLENLNQRGHEVTYFGPEAGEEKDWPEVTMQAVRPVAEGQADQAIVMCWTGTGASIVANKVVGIRAALCHDAETAKGAKLWNHANVMALSMRAISGPVAKEILEAWFSTPYSNDAWNLQQMARIRELETQKKD